LLAKIIAIIKQILKIEGDNAEGKNTLKELSTPIIKATQDINNKYGRINLVKVIVRFNLSGCALNPGAMTRTMTGAAITPIITIKVFTKRTSNKAVLTNFQNSSFFFLTKYSEKTGTNTELLAPSPTRSLNILGSLNATKNDCIIHPVPKILAIKISLTNPKILERNVALLKTDTDLTSDFFENIFA